MYENAGNIVPVYIAHKEMEIVDVPWMDSSVYLLSMFETY